MIPIKYMLYNKKVTAAITNEVITAVTLYIGITFSAPADTRILLFCAS